MLTVTVCDGHQRSQSERTVPAADVLLGHLRRHLAHIDRVLLTMGHGENQEGLRDAELGPAETTRGRCRQRGRRDGSDRNTAMRRNTNGSKRRSSVINWAPACGAICG
jgi:hypothetical protein